MTATVRWTRYFTGVTWVCNFLYAVVQVRGDFIDYNVGLQVDFLRNVVHNAVKLSLNEFQRLT